MAQKTALRTTFEAAKVIEPIYTGGGVALSADGQILATCLGEDALLTDLQNGRRLARIDGDGETITTLSLTPSASHLILCSRSLSMRIYVLDRSSTDAVTATLSRTLKPHTSPVVSAAVDESGTLIATGGADGIVKIWDIRGGYTTHTLHGHSGIVSALYFFKIDPGKQRVSAEEQDKRTKKQRKSDAGDLEQGELATFRLASGDEGGSIRIWHLQKRKCVAVLDSHVSVIRGLDFDVNRQLLLSGSRDKTAMLWDASTWKVQTTVPVLESLETAGFVPGQRYFFTGGESGRLRLWWVDGGEATEDQQPRHEEQSITNVIFNRSTLALLSIHADQNIRLHAIRAEVPKSNAKFTPLSVVRQISGTHDEIIDCAYIGGSDNLLAVATNTEEIKILSLNSSDDSFNSRETYFGADVGLLQGHADIIICLDVDWSGHWLATGAKDNTARLWRIDPSNDSYLCTAILTGHAESLGAVTLPKQRPPEGSPAYSQPLQHPPPFLVTGSQDKTIKLWGLSILKPDVCDQKIARATYTRKAHDKDINSLDISSDSRLFASASQDRTVKIWSLEDGESIGVLRGHKRGVWSAAFSPKDVMNISGDAGASSGGRGYVVTASGDKTVKLWSLSDYSCLRTFEGHTNSVLKVLWLPTAPPIVPTAEDDEMYSDDEMDDGFPQPHRSQQQPLPSPPQIASSGSDGLVKIWEATSGECACTLDNHTDRVWALASAPPIQTPSRTITSSTSSPHPSTTRTLVSGAADATITLWRDTTFRTYTQLTTRANERVEQDQTLQNYIRAANYREAIVLALQLNHPARLLALFTAVVRTHPPEAGSLSGVCAVDEVLGTLGDEQLLALLGRLRDWNVSAKTCMVAQRVLWTLLRLYPAARFTRLRGGRKGGNVKEVLDALSVYTERHYRRWEELMDQSWLVDYTLGQMDELAGASAGALENGARPIDARVKAVNGGAIGEDVIMLD